MRTRMLWAALGVAVLHALGGCPAPAPMTGSETGGTPTIQDTPGGLSASDGAAGVVTPAQPTFTTWPVPWSRDGLISGDQRSPLPSEAAGRDYERLFNSLSPDLRSSVVLPPPQREATVPLSPPPAPPPPPPVLSCSSWGTFTSRRNAVDFVARQLASYAQVWSVWGDLGNPAVEFVPLSTKSWPGCPNIWVVSGELTAFIVLKFETACTPPTGTDVPVFGSGGMIWLAEYARVAVYVADLFIDGARVVPHQRHRYFRDDLPVLMDAQIIEEDGGKRFIGNADFELESAWRTGGLLNLLIESDYTLEFTDGALTSQAATHCSAFEFSGLVFRPAVHLNFVPEAGFVTAQANVDGQLVTFEIIFQPDSPTTGKVLVASPGGTPSVHTLPTDMWSAP